MCKIEMPITVTTTDYMPYVKTKAYFLWQTGVKQLFKVKQLTDREVTDNADTAASFNNDAC